MSNKKFQIIKLDLPGGVKLRVETGREGVDFGISRPGESEAAARLPWAVWYKIRTRLVRPKEAKTPGQASEKG